MCVMYIHICITCVYICLRIIVQHNSDCNTSTRTLLARDHGDAVHYIVTLQVDLPPGRCRPRRPAAICTGIITDTIDGVHSGCHTICGALVGRFASSHVNDVFCNTNVSFVRYLCSVLG